MKLRGYAIVLGFVSLAFPAEKTAAQLAKEGQQAELNGDVTRAYVLYSEAAAKDPANRLLWLHAQTLRPMAEAKLKKSAEKPKSPESPLDQTLMGAISDQELEQARKLLPPPHLEAAPGTQDLDLRGDSKQLFERVAAAYKLDVIFDPAYQPKTGLRLQLTGSNYADALRALEAASDSFAVPVNEHRLLVANESVQKRQEFDRTAAIAIPAPEPVTVQELQEIATAIRGTLDIQRLVVDANRRMVLLRDRVSKVLLAEKLVEDLMRPKAQVAVEVELTELDENVSTHWGISLPTSFSLVWIGEPNSHHLISNVPPGSYLSFGGGKTTMAIGISSAGLFAIATRGMSTTVLKSEVVTSEGQAATLHVGDKYPIVTSGYFGASSTTGTVYTPPPTINFEDLGLALKITPFVHGRDEVTLEVEAEFKLLGSTSVDNIPVISNRRFQSKVRLENGEWAVMSGLMSGSEARTISGLAGLSVIPILRDNQNMKSHTEALIVLKPHLLNLPPTETVTRAAWVGTETRPRTAL